MSSSLGVLRKHGLHAWLSLPTDIFRYPPVEQELLFSEASMPRSLNILRYAARGMQQRLGCCSVLESDI